MTDTDTEQTTNAQPFASTDAGNWRDALPAEIRDADDLKQIGDVSELANKYIATLKHVTTGNEMGDTPESKAAFFKKYGKPENESGYTFALPEELKDDKDVKTFTDVLRKAAFAGNMTDEQFTAMMDSVLSQPAVFEDKANEEKQKREQVLNEYAAKCGADFQRKISDVNAICAVAGPEFTEHLIAAGMGFDPVVIEGLLKLGEGFVEKSGGLYRSDGQRVYTGKELDAQIAKLQADKAYTDASDPRHKHVVGQVAALYKEKCGE